jgi:hypothetical protein
MCERGVGRRTDERMWGEGSGVGLQVKLKRMYRVVVLCSCALAIGAAAYVGSSRERTERGSL